MFAEIITPKELKNLFDYKNIKGIILSGGPSTVTKQKYLSVPKEFFQKNTYRYLLWSTTHS